jgi:hypothetical protein
MKELERNADGTYKEVNQIYMCETCHAELGMPELLEDGLLVHRGWDCPRGCGLMKYIGFRLNPEGEG